MIKYFKLLPVLCMLTFSMLPVSRAKAQDDAKIQAGNGVIIGIGIGSASGRVEPNIDDTYYEGTGLGLSFGAAVEKALSPSFGLTARVDAFSALKFSLFYDTATSYGLLATAGFNLGKLNQPGSLYLSGSVGAGVAVLSDYGLDQEGSRNCIVYCESKQGGSSAGLAGRLAIGMTGKLNQRYELVLMRTGGDGNDTDYQNNEEAYLQTVMLQVSAKSK